MFRNIEKKLNNRLLDFVIEWSYLGDHRPKRFEKFKKIGMEAYVHILEQYEKFTHRYRN